MFERVLSSRGRKVYIVFMVLMMGMLVWQIFTKSGPAGWLNRFQAEHLFSGTYYPELTLAILAIPILAISFGIGLFHDYLMGQGIFADKENASDFGNPGSISEVQYQMTMRADMIDQVRSKFKNEIQQLKDLGFEESGFMREIVPWFGIPMGFNGVLGATGVLSNEVTRMGPNLTVNGFYPLMISRKDSAYASVSKLGIKFTSSFNDGTCLQTAAYKGIEFQDEAQKLYRTASAGPLPSAWTNHQLQVGKFQSNGRVVNQNINTTDYFSLTMRLNDTIQKHRSKVVQPNGKKRPFLTETVATIISTFVSLGILFSLVAAFLFAANVTHVLYPSCRFVRNIGTMPLWLNLALVPALLGTSWALARSQHNLFTLNGMGTQLFGKEPVPNSGQFVATKWLAIPWVPLIPVRSYLVTIEPGNPLQRPAYALQPLSQINWNQVSQTARKSIIGYAILICIYIAFVAWTVSECR